MILNESENVIFADTEEFDQVLTLPLQGVIDAALSKIGLTTYRVGSGFRPTTGMYSGDLDLQVDLDQIIDHFNAQPDPSKKGDTVDSASRRALAAYMNKLGFQTNQKGINVFVRAPLDGKFYQVDLECIRKANKVSRYHQHNIPAGSTYKGVGKQLMLAMLAKEKGFVYSAWEGLYKRTPDNKKGELVADEWDEMAKLLLGPQFSGNDMDSVEAIMAALPPEYAQELLARGKADKNWKERKPRTESIRVGTNEWFRNMLNRL
jgi:hypothetical protein